jgi:putative membrane protein
VRARTLLALAAAAVLVAGVSVGPVNRIAETRLFAVHMAQHLVVGDLAPLLVVVAAGARAPRIPPLLALAAWAASLYAWHAPAVYEAALAHDAVHALQHVCFFLAGAALWRAVLGPSSLPWRLACLAAAGILSAVLGNVFLWSARAFYAPYVDAPALWGLSPVEDQRLGGAIMLGEGTVVVVAVFAWVALRWLAEGDERRDLAAR